MHESDGLTRYVALELLSTMPFLFYCLALTLQTPQDSYQPAAPQQLQQQAPTTVPQATLQATPQATVQQEVLGPDQQVYITEYGGYCVGQQVLQGSPEAVGKWRVKYKVDTPEGTYTYKASGHGAESYAQAGDPYGFVAWLNGVRASYGLGAVGYDPNLSNWAAMNNNHQASRGLGHHVMGPARRQNSAMGGFPGIEAMWMASPAHRAALLDPTITWVGIAGAGAWWTFNAN